MFRPSLLAMLFLCTLQTGCIIEIERRSKSTSENDSTGSTTDSTGETPPVITDTPIPDNDEPNTEESPSCKPKSSPNQLVSALMVSAALVGCTSDANDGITVSGRLFTTANVMIDGDVNDTSAVYHSNDDPSDPQALPNIVTVQGFASASPTFAQESEDANFERFANSSDVDDYFLVSLQAGQKIVLNVVDYDDNAINGAYSGDLDLFLFNADLSSNDPIAFSNSDSSTEQINIAVDGEYLVLVTAYSGISKYVMQILPTSSSILGQAAEPTHSASFVPGEAIIRWKDNQPSSALKAATTGIQANGRSVHVLSQGANYPVKARLQKPLSALSVRSPLAKLNPQWDEARDTLETIKALSQRDDVEYAEPNYIHRALLTPNDPLYDIQFHYKSIKLPQAWDLTDGSSDAIVAVIDSGVFLDHPDLSGKLVAGYDFISDTSTSRDGDGIDSDPDDPGDNPQKGASAWHGTHVTGTVAAVTNNSRGGAGAGGLTRVMPLRVLGLNGEGSSYDVIQAVRYAAKLSNDSGTTPTKRADIINLSLGSSFNSNAEQEVFTAARNAGVIIVAAAGNSSSSTPFYPASYNGVVSVSASAPDNSLAEYSNFGSRIDVAAPGGEIRYDINGDGQDDGVLSTSVNDSSGTREESYTLQEGTSMASPHVAAVVALMKAVYPSLTPTQFDNLLSAGDITDDLGDPGRDNEFGHGRINAYKAVLAADNLAGGGSITPVPVLESSPNELFLGTNASISFTLDNINNEIDDPAITSDVSEDWITLDNSQTDTNGLGTYTVTVDRSGLLDGLYEGVIRFTPDTGNSLDVRISIQVGDIVEAVNIAPQYVLLLDAESGDVIVETLANADGTYTVKNVPAGSYRVIGGSDIDVDLFVCQNGETCGGYPSIVTEEVIDVSESITGINFLVSLVSGISSNNLSAQRSAPVMETVANKEKPIKQLAD